MNAPEVRLERQSTEQMGIRPDLALNAQSPYPGLLSFQERDRAFFFGREQDQLELFRLVRRDVLTVLFGQSGLGKTSLLQASLFPMLREALHLPIPIRLDFTSDGPDFITQVKTVVRKEIESQGIDASLPGAQDTLWEYFHREQFWDARNQLLTPVLVFDQFEEIFTRGQDSVHLKAFLAALADLVENRIPEAVRTRIAESGEELDFPYDTQNFRVVLSLREDFLAHLEDLRTQMPAIARNRLRLNQLTGAQALEAVLKPGRELVTEEVAVKIVRSVAGSTDTFGQDKAAVDLEQLQVEPALLALFCRELNERRREQGLSTISAGLFTGSKDRILLDFYERSLHGVHPALRQFIEENLLTEKGYRRDEALDDALRVDRVTEQAINLLVDRRLLRREERLGIPRIELIHDVLTPIVRTSRDQWRQQETSRKRRRRRVLLGGSVSAVTILAIVTSVVFSYLYTKAEAEKNKVTTLVQLAASKNKGLKEIGPNPFLKEMAQELLSRLKEDSDRNKTNNMDTVTAFDTYGDILLNQRDLSSALDAYRSALAISERLVKTPPYEDESQRSLWDSHSKIGNVYAQQGQFAKALAEYEAGLEVVKPLAAQTPSEWQDLLSQNYDKVGEIKIWQGDLVGALGAFEEDLKIHKRLADAAQNDRKLQLDLWARYAKIGELGLRVGNPGKLRDAVAKREDLLRTIMAQTQSDLQRNNLASQYREVGETLAEQGYLAGALDAGTVSVDIRNSLIASDSNNEDMLFGLAVTYTNIGNVQLRQGNSAKAFQAYKSGLDIREKLAVLAPTNKKWQRSLWLGRYKIGDIRVRQGELIEAKEAYEQALATIERVYKSKQQWQADFSGTYNKVGDVLLQQGKFTEASDAYTRALVLIKPLADQSPTNDDWQELLAMSYNNIGDIQLRLGKFKEAGAAYQSGLEIAKRLVGWEWRNLLWQECLSRNYRGQANLHFTQGNFEKAVDLAKRSVEPLSVLIKGDVENVSLKQELAKAYGDLARYVLFSRQPQQAIEASHKGLELDSSTTTLKLLLAHGYLFSDQYEQAWGIYSKEKDTVMGNGGKTFGQAALDDFQKFANKGLSHPRMADIERLLSKKPK